MTAAIIAALVHVLQLVVEWHGGFISLWFTAIALYVRATRPRGRTGVYAFWTMIGILTALWLVSLRGDPPPSLSAMARVNTVFFAVMLAWSAWMDHTRTVNRPVA